MDITEIQEFFNKTRRYINDYQEATKKAEESIGFNVFRILSDYYYRENFHGDILEAIWTYNSNSEDRKYPFLQLFIKMIKDKEKIKTNYDDCTKLSREEPIDGNRRIDFVIENENEKDKHCIIIENKLYDAVDMPNQLPAYKEAMKKRGYTVDAIVYIPLSEYKTPDSSTWKNDVKVLIVPAKELIEKWLKPCIDYASKKNYVDIKVILEHYQKLLESLIPNKEKISAMIELYNFLKDQDRCKEALSLHTMLQNMPETMYSHIYNLILEDKEIKSFIDKCDLEPVNWAKSGFRIKNTEDVIHLECKFNWERAYTVLLVINGKAITSETEFNDLRNKRPDLNNLEFNSSPGSQSENNYLKLVKKFNFDEDKEVVDFIKKVIKHILKPSNTN